MVCVLYPPFLVSAFRVEFDSIRFPSPTIIICRGFDGVFECLSPTIANHHRMASGKLNFMAFTKVSPCARRKFYNFQEQRRKNKSLINVNYPKLWREANRKRNWKSLSSADPFNLQRSKCFSDWNCLSDHKRNGNFAPTRCTASSSEPLERA